MHIEFKHLTQDELKEVANYAFDLASSAMPKYLKIKDTEIHVRIEEGSLKSKITIGAALSTLYFGIATYGSFVRGVNTIVDQLHDVTHYINQEMIKHLKPGKQGIIARRNSTGVPGKLQKLFKEVEQGKLSADDATTMALSLLRQSSEGIPEEIEKDIKKSVSEIKPNQTLYDEERIEVPAEEIPSEAKKDKQPFKQRKYPLDIPFHDRPRRRRKLGVEVWKTPLDSKRKIRYY